MRTTKLEKQRFEAFKALHPDARRKYEYPPECGYYLYAVSKKDGVKEEITDVDFMANNV